MEKGEPWNHSVHYHDFILRSVPRECRRALEVGCGHGELARKLALLGGHVVAIDADQTSLACARNSEHSPPQIEYVGADVMTYPFAPETFDCITAVAVLHHLPLESALVRLRDLLAPGGVLIVIGLYKANTIADYVVAAGAVLVSLVLRRIHRYEEVAAPLVNPATSLADIRTVSRNLLAGSVITRLLLFRYSLVWRKPTCEAVFPDARMPCPDFADFSGRLQTDRPPEKTAPSHSPG